MNHPINLQYKMGNFSNLDRWIINHLSDGMAPKPCSDALIQSPRLVQEGTWAPTSRPSSIRLFTDVVGPATLLSSSFLSFVTSGPSIAYKVTSKTRCAGHIKPSWNGKEASCRTPSASGRAGRRTFVVGFFWCQSFTLRKSQSKMINELGELAGFGRTTSRGCFDFFFLLLILAGKVG